MIAIWGKNLSTCKNVTLGFTLTLPSESNFTLKLSGASVYQVFLDGKLVGFGPYRTSLGYARIASFNLKGKRLVIKVHSHAINAYAYIKQAPFFAAELSTENGTTYDSHAFKCYFLNDRIRKVPRYSYQRGFSEVYQHTFDPSVLLDKDTEKYPLVFTEDVTLPNVLTSHILHPLIQEHRSILLHVGSVSEAQLKEKWRPPFVTLVGDKLEGYSEQECEQIPFDEVDTFVFDKNDESDIAQYQLHDFKRALTGFFCLEVTQSESGSIYLLFDEILDEKTRLVNYKRNTTNNLIKWTFTKKGTYRVISLEPYTARYVTLIKPCDSEVKLSIFDYENPMLNCLKLKTNDEEVNVLFEAARHTFAQNAVDILMDCPSRERAGWLADSYFTSLAERYFTGNNRVEKAFLENYTLIKNTRLPLGMIPMVYPADDYDQVFIPNWSLWYILELSKYRHFNGEDEVFVKSKEVVRGIINYFKDYENEYGLLENLESWVFVEWSEANDYEHIRGVNIPTNALYALALEEAASIFGNDESLLQKSIKIRQAIKILAFDGKFFVDNLIRHECNLVKTAHYTEVCQYYLFWTRAISSEEYPELYNILMQELGPYRTKKYSSIAPPNMMYGIYMRLDLLMRDKEQVELLKECKLYFLNMANKTGTLWENNLPSASCNHGFASYLIKWLVYALTGFDLLSEEDEYKPNIIGISGTISIPNGPTLIFSESEAQ